MKRIDLIRVAVVVLTARGLFGQPAAPPLTFEVASVKPSAPDARGTSIEIQPGGGLRVSNAPLKMLLTVAFDVRDFQLSGGPGWISSDRYDIVARPERSTNPDAAPPDPRKLSDAQLKTMGEQMRERLRALLADRFQLTVHRENKEAPVYALVVAKNGPKLQVAEEGKDGRRGMRMGRGQLSGMSAPLSMLATTLSNQLGRPVLDRTGLSGKYDFKLEWTPDPGQGEEKPGVPPPGVEAPPPPDANGPSIFTALQEQLGLRLESQKGPMEIIVIDRVEKASEN
ncbi:MAG TPA: TIGR03435 family protein [Bryobacteraceae bacterium]